MQFKAHISGPLRLMWDRISFTRLTLLYFCFSIAHFVIQVSLQINAFIINADAASFLSRIVNDAQTTNRSLPYLQNGNILRMCSWVPANLNVDVASCPVVWNGTAAALANVENTNAVGAALPDLAANSSATVSNATVIYAVPQYSVTPASSSSPLPSSSYSSSSSTVTLSSAAVSSSTTASAVQEVTLTHTVFAQPSPTFTTIHGNSATDSDSEFGDDSDDNDELNNGGYDDRATNGGFKFEHFRRDINITAIQDGQSVSVTLVGLQENPVILSNACLWSLNWPVSILRDTKREDMVFIGFQIWVLGMSVVALLNESIPHIMASLATHMIATGWAAFQIKHTAQFHADYNRIITNGACDASLLPNYWDARAKAEIPGLALNIAGLFISCFLTWKLIKLFGWQTFKRVGASLSINRIYKFVLFLSITIQLSLFFMIVTVSLWVDQLLNSVIGDLASFQKLYKVTSFIILALLVPWLMTGWFAVRRELRVPMHIFLLLSVLYLGHWGMMFISTTFRWTFITWTFFSIMAIASVGLTVLSIVLGCVCRYNFGKGLARYLNAQQPLDDEDSLSYYGDEKVAFPQSDRPLPTYAGSFDEKDPGYGYGYGHATYNQGPRFANKFAEPFESAPGLAYPAPALSRNVTDLPLQRTDSRGSTRSHGSSSSSGSSNSQRSHFRNDSDNSRVGQKQRWIIE